AAALDPGRGADGAAQADGAAGALLAPRGRDGAPARAGRHAPPGERGAGVSARVDAVVVSYRSAATLRGCVEPLAAMPGVHVTVVDNASPDDSLATIAGLDVSVVRSPRNGGFSYGCNLGAAQGSAPLLLFVNPDARIDAAALEALRAAL